MKILLDFLLTTLIVNTIVKCNGERENISVLFDAVEEGKADVVAWLLNHGIDVNERDIDGRTPLMQASKKKDGLKIVQILMKEDADVNARDNNGQTPLFYSATSGREDVFELLLKNGSNHAAKDNRGRTVVHIVADKGSCKILDKINDLTELSNTTDDWGRIPIWYAASQGNFECFLTLKRIGPEINEDIIIAAVEGGNFNIFKTLWEDGLLNNTEAKYTAGMTLLQIVIEKNNTELAMFLIENGADVNVTDLTGRHLIHLASLAGSNELVSYFLINGINANVRDNLGNTAAHYAALSDCSLVLSTLIKHGARMDYRNNDDKTPIELAVENNNQQALTYLINAGENVEGIDGYGRTLMHIAAEYKANLSLELLIKKGALINVSDGLGNQPIHYAINDAEILKPLLEAGADVETPGSKGRTPLEMAVDAVNINAAKCLLKYGADPEKVKKIYIPGDNYNSYIITPSIPTKRTIYELFDKISKGEINAKDLEC